MTQDTIEREITIEAPVERVWSILTEADHLGTWFGDAGATIELRPGGPMTLEFAGYGKGLAEVVAVEPPHRFSYRWVPGETDVAPTDENSTLVEFTLQPGAGGTLLRVHESGFARLPAATRAGNVQGWKQKLGQLQEHAARVAA